MTFFAGRIATAPPPRDLSSRIDGCSGCGDTTLNKASIVLQPRIGFGVLYIVIECIDAGGVAGWADNNRFAAVLTTPHVCLDVVFNVAAPIENPRAQSHVGTAGAGGAFAVQGSQTAPAYPRIFGRSQKFRCRPSLCLRAAR